MHTILLLISSVGAHMSPKIVGGGPASMKDWPFIAFIYGFSPSTETTCGGTLISSQSVLSAAHCFDDVTDHKKTFHKFNFAIYMGHRLITKAKMVRNVTDYISHEKYDQNENFYDICVLFLTNSVKFSSAVKKVLLLPSLKGYTQNWMVAGWGRWSIIDDSPSPYLKALQQTVLSRRKCKKYLTDEVSQSNVGVLCAGEPRSSEFAYYGDSGGPLTIAGEHIQIGIVSFRLNRIALSVYTSIPYYFNWIENIQSTYYKKMLCKKTKVKTQDIELIDDEVEKKEEYNYFV